MSGQGGAQGGRQCGRIGVAQVHHVDIARRVVATTGVVQFANQQGLGALWHGVGDDYHLHLQLKD